MYKWVQPPNASGMHCGEKSLEISHGPSLTLHHVWHLLFVDLVDTELLRNTRTNSTPTCNLEEHLLEPGCHAALPSRLNKKKKHG